MKHENLSSFEGGMQLPSMAGLQAFEAAARHASFAGAAAELGRTPSAISHAIKDLESKLRTSLFERSGRSVTLTDTGQDYLGSVQTALADLNAAAKRLQQKREDHIVRISALPFFTSAVLLPNLSRFESDYPDLELRIETSNVYADVQNGEADIAIRFGSQHIGNLYCKPLVEVRGQPIAAPAYLASNPPISCADDLRAHTLIQVQPDLQAWKSWGLANGAEELSGQHALTFDSILGAIDAVKAGSGIALGMAPLIKTYPGYGIDFVPILSSGVARGIPYQFVCRKTAVEDQKIRRTLKWLESAIESQLNHK